MSKLNVYLKVATDSTVNPIAEKLKRQDERINELTNQLRRMIEGTNFNKNKIFIYFFQKNVEKLLFFQNKLNVFILIFIFLESDDEILKDWKFEDEFLVRFIRGRKYNIASALEKVSKILAYF